MARTAAKGTVRKDAVDDTDEVSPEMLEALADRVQDGDGDEDGDDDEVIALDEDGEGDDDAGEDGDASQEIGDNLDLDGDDDDDDQDDADEDEDDDSDSAADDDEDADEDEDLDDDEDDDTDEDDGLDDSDDDEDTDDMAKDMTADAPKDVVDEEEVEETKPEDGDGKKKNDEEAKKSTDLAADLRRAVDAMAAHGRRADPQMRKEALMAKELNGGGLSRAEKLELSKMLVGGPEVSRLQKSVLSAQNGGAEALKKSMVSNEAMGLAYDNITKSLLAQAEHLENSCQGIEQTQFLMAKAVVKVGETLAALSDRQGQLAKSVRVMSRQPVAPPRSVGVDWARKSLAGARVPDGNPGADKAGNKRLAKASPSKIDEALGALAKSAGQQSEMGRAYSSARDAIAINRPLMPSIAAKVEEYLADH